MYVSLCVSVACVISGTNLPMAVNQPKIILMLRKFEFRAIHRCEFQIYNQISDI